MFTSARPSTVAGGTFGILERTYYVTAHSIRSGHVNAIYAILLNILQTLIFIGIFFGMFMLLGIKGSALRGDFILFIVSGVFLFMVNTRTMSAVAGADGPLSAMMQHAPMNAAISIVGAALAALYTQILGMGVILFLYHAAVTPITIAEPMGFFGMVMLAWANGIAVGLVVRSLTTWFPRVGAIIKMIYMRANMIASGKMFVANALPYTMLNMFDWNPLFHIVDQGRGYMFVNYFPRYSEISYVVYVTIALAALGLMAEFYTRQHVSLSWKARG